MGLDFTLWKRRGNILRLVQIPGGTDGFKVNRGDQTLWSSLKGEPDSRQRLGHMSTSNTRRLKRGWVIVGLFIGQSRGLRHYLIYAAYAWKRWLIAGSGPSRRWGQAWEKELQRGSNLGESRCTVTTGLKKPHARQFKFSLVEYPLCSKPLQPFQGHVPARTSVGTTSHQADTGHSKGPQ